MSRSIFTLGNAWHEFWRHPSPWMIATTVVASVAARIFIGGWAWTDVLVPIVLIASFPFVEWLIHVCILHWRPRHIAGLTIDPLLARKHREHHVNPRYIPLIFIPWQALLFWVLPALVAVSLLAFPRVGLGLTYLACVAIVGFGYEWAHYLIHSDYRPKTLVYKSIWKNHRLHHYRNEHYWFSITTTGTSDRVLHTYPDPATVPTSPTAKNLHALDIR